MFEGIRSLFFFSISDIFNLGFNKFYKRLPKANMLTYTRHAIKDILKAGGSIKAGNGAFLIERYEGFNFFTRKNSSDIKVFNQVWINKEYNAAIEYINEKKLDIHTILDCGANVGYTSIFFRKYFSKAKIVAVEADAKNADIAKQNIALNKITNIEILQKAVWYKPAKLKITSDFRGGENWSFAVEETNNPALANVEAISIRDIINAYNWTSIDVLKMDIEGAERYLFRDNYTSNFLEITKCLIIEVHDEYNIRNTIYEQLKHAGFSWIESGELTIALNQNLIASK